MGPHISRYTMALFPRRFLGSYLFLTLYVAVTILALTKLTLAKPLPVEQIASTTRLSVIIRKPAVLVAVTSATLANGVMVLMMVSTPLAMSFCGHSYADATSVVGWHFIGMLAPSLLTGWLIRRFGPLKVMLVGTALLYSCTAISLSGSAVAYFWAAMFLLGVGWNLVYIGGASLLVNSCLPEEMAVSQGLNDMSIAAVQVITSVCAGAIVTSGGWNSLGYLSLACITIIVSVLLWLMRTSRPRPADAGRTAGSETPYCRPAEALTTTGEE